MDSVRSVILCLLSILAALLVCSEAGAVSLPPTPIAPQFPLPREAVEEGVSLWNLLNPWSAVLADKGQSFSFERDNAGGEGATRAADAANGRRSHPDHDNTLRHSSLLLSPDGLVAPGQATSAGTSTSGPSHTPGSWVALTTHPDDLSPLLGGQLTWERGCGHAILRPRSVFHPPRR